MRISAPRGGRARPTTDRVREATFNALGSMGLVEGMSFVDAFAGSGALGIEALSRGAAGCVFIESGRRELDSLRANLASTKLGERARVLGGDAMALLGADGQPGGQPGGVPADVLLADPPYEFDRWAELVGLAAAPVVVAESDRPVEVPHGWDVVRQRRYGSTIVTIIEAQPGTADTGGDSDPGTGMPQPPVRQNPEAGPTGS